MSYHNTSSAAQSTTLYGEKIIRSFDLDTSDIKEAGERRNFTVSGDKGAVFSLEVREGVNYYNFETGLFQTTKTKLANVEVMGGSYRGSIKFPRPTPSIDTVNGAITSGTTITMDSAVASKMQVGDRVTGNTALSAGVFTVVSIDSTNVFSLSDEVAIADGVTLSFTNGAQYDVYLFTENGTKHAKYDEVRFLDNSIDINSTTGSNSNLIQKVIYQTLDVTLTLTGHSSNGTITNVTGTQVITTSRNASTSVIPFSFIVTTGASNTLAITKQPVSSDVMAFLVLTPGATPLDIEGEDIYPAVTAADKVVNGAIEDGATNVTMDDDFTGLWAVGDRITGNAALDAKTQATAVTVTAINVGSNAKVFTMSEAIDINDDETLNFSNRRNYRWSFDNIYGLTPGMRGLDGGYFGTQPTIKEYLTQTIVNEGQRDEYRVDGVRIPALDALGVLPVTTRDGTTKVETTVQAGNVIFSEQALLPFGGGANAKIFSYGESEINRLTGYDVEFTDLAVALTEVTTTTTAAVNNSTSVPITNRIGISDNISTVSGIGVDSSVANPTVASGAGSVTGAGTIVLSAAQTLESGITLTFPGAGSVATITGNIKVNKAGNENVVLRFDLEKFLTMQ